ncbi:NFACT RNA binding domain-containing protein [Desulfovibrio ferrophilus]|uniref:NFACT RNA-binding domain-containing protein n=1 Tax=Desulfovibrio ferrophilus TaxID=241368 RepID=A0A2Z6AUR6_9BACT|nr:NFACT RNA binding domain-containing protein [Desulfovibrio ferrophilus]BBD06979.1 uncharacterized protein DFE_0253 [Desulfovibrio ferrophilus]
MEANFFRCLARDLVRELSGSRVDKIYNPAPDVWTFKVGTHGGASFLLLRASQRQGLLFLTSEKPANPASPSAQCMWFRKRLVNRRLLDACVDWTARAVAFALSPGEGNWLMLSPQGAPALVDQLPAGFGDEPPWPEFRALADEDAWLSYPQLTPPLRRLLSTMAEGRGQAVLDAVRRGGCSQFFLYQGAGGPQLLPWRLPETLRDSRSESVYASALEAADELGRGELFPHLRDLAEAGERSALKVERRRMKRSLASVDRDQERLEGMVALSRYGEALRGELYRLDKHEKLKEVEVPGPDGEPLCLELDRRLTVAENMERFFKLAAKGRRGLEFVKIRRRELLRRQAELEQGRLPDEIMERLERGEQRSKVRQVPPTVRKGLSAFRTEDGFAVYRGKNAQANHDLVRKVASPFDLWFHARGGAGSHVVLRRDYPDQDVPQRSLEQAATLAGLRSFAAGNARAEVICAQVKHVHAVKGAGPGKVTVDLEVAALSVSLDPELEKRLGVD